MMFSRAYISINFLSKLLGFKITELDERMTSKGAGLNQQPLWDQPEPATSVGTGLRE